MLPFTKRPGRENESGDVVTKDDLEDPPTSLAKRSVPPPAGSERPRKLMPSLSDDELTALMPSKSVGTMNPLPAAGRPASIPPPGRTPSVPPPARSSRAPAQMDDDGEGRTMVRGSPKVVRRTNNSQPPPKMGLPTSPTTVSPAAVIKATIESARAQKRNDIMAGPPIDLLEDRADVHPADAGPQRTVQLDSSQSGNVPALGVQVATQALSPQGAVMMHRSVPPAPGSYPGANSAFPPPPASYPPPPMSYPPMNQQGMNPYGATVQSSSVPGVSMPPHFMVPQAPYSDGRVDPPATSVTSNHRVAGRPAVSWAAALLAFGLFVGVGAVAVMQNSGDGLVDTTASFVDPSRAPGGRAGAPAAQPAPLPAPVDAPKPADPATNAAPAAPPPVNAPPASPPAVAPPPFAATPAPPAPAALAPGVIGVSTPPATPPAPATTEAAAKPPEPAKPPAAVATFKPPPRTWSPPPSPPRAAPPPPSDDDAPKKTAAAKKGSKGGGDDEEMKKALEQLQKSQLEQSLKE